jgi:hypothetical protein
VRQPDRGDPTRDLRLNRNLTRFCAGLNTPFVYITKGVESAPWQTRRYPAVTKVQGIDRAKSRELAHRVTSCVEVTLLWRKLDNALTLRLVEIATGIEFEIGVQPEDAFDAFNHPYAYLRVPKLDSLNLLAA